MWNGDNSEEREGVGTEQGVSYEQKVRKNECKLEQRRGGGGGEGVRFVLYQGWVGYDSTEHNIFTKRERSSEMK